MQSYLSRELADERQRRLLSDAQRAQLAAQASSAVTDGRAPRAVLRAVGNLLIALGSRLGGAISAPAEPPRPAPEGQIVTAP
ncbi:MAG: hypothetical protein ACRDJW_11060 [Thermomicrobiales bacterium]